MGGLSFVPFNIFCPPSSDPLESFKYIFPLISRASLSSHLSNSKLSPLWVLVEPEWNGLVLLRVFFLKATSIQNNKHQGEDNDGGVGGGARRTSTKEEIKVVFLILFKYSLQQMRHCAFIGRINTTPGSNLHVAHSTSVL